MRNIATGIGGLLAVLFVLAQLLFWFGTSLGVVREHCADAETSSPESGLDVDSSWTYILWPPLVFANADPAGTCVRNAPLREALDQVGIWDLPSAEEQVADHLREQFESRRQ